MSILPGQSRIIKKKKGGESTPFPQRNKNQVVQIDLFMNKEEWLVGIAAGLPHTGQCSLGESSHWLTNPCNLGQCKGNDHRTSSYLALSV